MSGKLLKVPCDLVAASLAELLEKLEIRTHDPLWEPHPEEELLCSLRGHIDVLDWLSERP